MRRYGGDRAAVGRTLTLNGQPYEIVGVLPQSFSLPREVMPTLGVVADGEVYLPLPIAPTDANVRNAEDYNIVGRLKRGVSMAQAQAEMDGITARLRRDFPAVYPPNGGLTFSVVPLLEQVVGNVRRPLVILLVSVGCVLLIACANVANLLLARALGREREMSVRIALGAGRGRLVRQLLTESVMLAAAGGVLGILLAIAERALAARVPAGRRPAPRRHRGEPAGAGVHRRHLGRRRHPLRPGAGARHAAGIVAARDAQRARRVGHGRGLEPRSSPPSSAGRRRAGARGDPAHRRRPAHPELRAGPADRAGLHRRQHHVVRADDAAAEVPERRRGDQRLPLGVGQAGRPARRDVGRRRDDAPAQPVLRLGADHHRRPHAAGGRSLHQRRPAHGDVEVLRDDGDPARHRPVLHRRGHARSAARRHRRPPPGADAVSRREPARPAAEVRRRQLAIGVGDDRRRRRRRQAVRARRRLAHRAVPSAHAEPVAIAVRRPEDGARRGVADAGRRRRDPRPRSRRARSIACGR